MQLSSEKCALFSNCVQVQVIFFLNNYTFQDRAVIMGIERGEASYLLSIIGISSIVGKIGLGYLSDHPRINRMYLYNTCLIICGISEY